MIKFVSNFVFYGCGKQVYTGRSLLIFHVIIYLHLFEGLFSYTLKAIPVYCASSSLN